MEKLDKDEIGNALVVSLVKSALVVSLVRAVMDAFPDQDIKVELNGEEIIVDIDEEDEEKC